MENKVSAYNLISILESAVSKAQESVGRQYTDNLRSYFNEDKTPKQINLEVNSQSVVLPEICTANLKPISVKEININLSCCIEGVDNNELILDLSKSDEKNNIKINIVLNSENEPEAVMRINDMLISEYIP
ncbi:MAG: DUF2589 domain-containing protein [Oscillospiraceae bacterium]|nr:DUF2589 domain-containing protein [Oscillospiraceae bacterium]